MTSHPDIKSAIQAGDAAALESLLSEDPTRANQLIIWGKDSEIHTHPLHYISDMLFVGTLGRGKELPLIEVLLQAGSNPNHQAENGETPLIGAASLNAEDVGLRLLEAGAKVDSKAVWNSTALHWAAYLGLPRLVAKLIARGADITAIDTNYQATPLEWAVFGCIHQELVATQGNFVEAVSMLKAAGSEVKPQLLQNDKVRTNAAVLNALSS